MQRHSVPLAASRCRCPAGYAVLELGGVPGHRPEQPGNVADRQEHPAAPEHRRRRGRREVGGEPGAAEQAERDGDEPDQHVQARSPRGVAVAALTPPHPTPARRSHVAGVGVDRVGLAEHLRVRLQQRPLVLAVGVLDEERAHLAADLDLPQAFADVEATDLAGLGVGQRQHLLRELELVGCLVVGHAGTGLGQHALGDLAHRRAGSAQVLELVEDQPDPDAPLPGELLLRGQAGGEVPVADAHHPPALVVPDLAAYPVLAHQGLLHPRLRAGHDQRQRLVGDLQPFEVQHHQVVVEVDVRCRRAVEHARQVAVHEPVKHEVRVAGGVLECASVGEPGRLGVVVVQLEHRRDQFRQDRRRQPVGVRAGGDAGELLQCDGDRLAFGGGDRSAEGGARQRGEQTRCGRWRSPAPSPRQ